MDYRMKYRNGHVEVYDGWDRFLFSADTAQEARQEVKNRSERGAAAWN